MAFLIGILFGSGLTISNMTNPNKILNFLNVAGKHWDATLLVVMISAVIVTLIGYQIILKKNKPLLCEEFSLPKKSKIEKRLVIGSILFGIGWGMAGYCPGPSISALTTFNMDPVYFVIGMIMGSFGYYWLNKFFVDSSVR